MKNKERSRILLVPFLAVLLWLGCKPAVRGPSVKSLEQVQKNQTLAHLVGAWELAAKGGVKQMIFEPGGRLTFHGGLEFFNPAEWSLDTDHHELKITLVRTPNEKLDIFHMYIGDGVKAFDRARKEVTYDFNEQTWSLNVAGWIYSKPDDPAAKPEAEPVLK